MFFSKKQIWYLVLVSHHVLPLAIILGVMLLPAERGWLILGYAMAGALFLIGLSRVGSWEFTIVGFRYIYLAGLVSLTMLKFMLGHSQFGKIQRGEILLIILCVLLIIENIKILLGCWHQKKEIELAFPFKNGKYMITDGGNGKFSSLLNYHFKSSVHGTKNTNRSMMYAVDIVKLGASGRTSKDILKGDNSAYEIFKEAIYAPISGTVVSVENGIEDNEPFPKKLIYSIGNHVVIKSEDYYVVLGHFHKGSVVVTVGQEVNVGQRLGVIGNSGLTPRPHIHMQVSKCTDENYWAAQGVPILFNGKVPYKNRIYKL